jgi:hypothetical protein
LSRQGRGSNAEADLVDGGYLIATVYTKLGEHAPSLAPSA